MQMFFAKYKRLFSCALIKAYGTNDLNYLAWIMTRPEQYAESSTAVCEKYVSLIIATLRSIEYTKYENWAATEKSDE